MRWVAGLAAMAAAMWATAASATAYTYTETLTSSQVLLFDRPGYDPLTGKTILEPFYAQIVFDTPSSITLEPGDTLALTLDYPTPFTDFLHPPVITDGEFHFIPAHNPVDGRPGKTVGCVYFNLEELQTSAHFNYGAIAYFSYQLLPGYTTGAPITLGQEGGFQLGGPEPASWALMIAGVAMLGEPLRRGRQLSAA